MATLLTMIFQKAAIQELLDYNPDKIVVRSTVEEGTLDNGERVGVVKVYADAMNNDSPEPLHTITGCPVPPC